MNPVITGSVVLSFRSGSSRVHGPGKSRATRPRTEVTTFWPHRQQWNSRANDANASSTAWAVLASSPSAVEWGGAGSCSPGVASW